MKSEGKKKYKIYSTILGQWTESSWAQEEMELRTAGVSGVPCWGKETCSVWGEMEPCRAVLGSPGAGTVCRSLCTQGLRKGRGCPRPARHEGDTGTIPTSVLLWRTASKCSPPGASAGEQPETCQGKGSNYFARDNNTTCCNHSNNKKADKWWPLWGAFNLNKSSINFSYYW